MSTRILHAQTASLFFAAATQQAQCEALVAAFPGNVTVRVEGAGGQLLRTLTLGPFTINSNIPRGVVCGSVLADTAVSPNVPGAAGIAPVRWEFRADSTPIFETTDITQGPIRALCRPTFGSVVFTANPALSVSGGGAPLNTWQTLTIAPHSRKTSVLGPGNGTVQAFTTTIADALEAVVPEVTTELPMKAWTQLVLGERSQMYLAGGLHSNYPGSEIDRITLPKGGNLALTTELNFQPYRPPEGAFGGYFNGSTGYVYRQWGSLPDPSDWRPYIGHQWTANTWHPEWGYVALAAYALQASYPNGAYTLTGGLPTSSVAQPATQPPVFPSNLGFVGFDWATKKFKTYIPESQDNWGAGTVANYIGRTGVSDWNEHSNSMLFLCTATAGVTYLKIWHRSTNTLQDVGSTTLIGGAPGTNSNGAVVRWMEQEKYLILRVDNDLGAFTSSHKLLLFNRLMGANPNSGNDRFVTLTFPPEHTSDITNSHDGVAFWCDRNSRRIFWLVYPNKGVPIRFYRSTFDAPMVWTQITLTPAIQVPANEPFNSWIDAFKQPFVFEDGYLYIRDPVPVGGTKGYADGNLRMLRAKVDAGEDLPALTFTRYNYRIQNFGFSAAPTILQLRSVKHVNCAYRPVDQKHYFCSGDMGGSHNSSMATLSVTGSGPGDYLFTETLSEASFPGAGVGVFGAPFDGPTRMKRPVSPDDGAFVYSGAHNPNPAFRDKFLFMRGTDGSGWGTNTYTRSMYAAAEPDLTARAAWLSAGVQTPAIIAAMQADGWSIDRLMLFDPVKNGFSELRADLWPWTHGASYSVPHPVAALAQASSRNGVLDVSTNCAFRITNINNGIWLVRYDLTNQTISGFNCGAWTDAAGVVGPVGRTYDTRGPDPGEVNEEANVMSNGFGFFYAAIGRWVTSMPGEWEHKALWINEADGRLYAVSPATGYLWCFETRGTVTGSPDGNRIPFYPVGNRIPLVGTYPGMLSNRNWPPVLGRVGGPLGYGNIDVSMNSFLVPFKGGLLWWSSAHHDQGTFGRPVYAFWRRLGFTGDWTVMSMPREFASQCFSVKTPGLATNDELMLMCGGGNGNENIPTAEQPYFWRLT